MDAIQINRFFNLLSLVERDTKLSMHGEYHIGPCPFCSGTDRFTLKETENGYRWYCRKCGDERYHTAIDYVMCRNKIDFKAALMQLGDQIDNPFEKTPIKEPNQNQLVLPDSEWQAATVQEVSAASERLLTGEDPAGRDYLTSRGLHKGTWYAWQLGFTNIFDPKAKCKRPAIELPWFDLDPINYVITAVKYRFIDKNPKGLRYMSRRGSVPVLFGLWDALSEHHTLLLVEGEINALSIWQCLPSGVTCMSFGSEAGARTKILKVLASRYKQVLVWADDPRRAVKIKASIGQSAQALRSPDHNGEKWDANKMLQEGVLMEFLSQILEVPCLGWSIHHKLSYEEKLE